ncbi:unnamed protein product [Brassica oleracea var. botrytis]|uniref:Disease resistance protein winged helix domain-containing protein n=1 Tax=Brassica oleracea TaxID=3712 RepID=A0A3P6E493_BRAOL|nr:unnamed protein product [Brassica oleracea]
MSCKKKVREWNDALHVLTSSPRVEFAEKEDEILSILKYSYDSLKVGKLKSCFQYCALFPAGSMLSKDSLIEYWEVEGCVGGFGSHYIAKNRGYENIDTLVRAGLLMESDDSTKFVQMHDVVRKMALWVASDLGKNRERWVVEAGVGLRDMVPVQDWTGVRKMSLMNNEIEEISGGHDCHQLTTLFLQQNSNLVRISGEFFQYMPMLVVLNMSFTELEELIAGTDITFVRFAISQLVTDKDRAAARWFRKVETSRTSQLGNDQESREHLWVIKCIKSGGIGTTRFKRFARC